MKVLHINTFGNFSTGKIAVDIIKLLTKAGHEGKLAYARGSIEEGIPYIKIGNKLDVYFHGAMTRLTDKAGFYSKQATHKLIDDIERYDPDIIHLHNIHGYYINIEVLFNYLKNAGRPVIWTLHDCWAFTGHCCYFDALGCEKWMKKCFDCPQLNAYPKSIKDNSEKNYERKKELFTAIPNLTVVSVSKWLEGLVKKSFLNKHRIVQIYNGINSEVFKPEKSNFRDEYGLKDKFIILGVASTWEPRKGLGEFLKLSDMLDDTFRIVLVGLNKKQIKLMKKNMIGIERTRTQKELVEIYTTSDVFVNPTLEDNFPTVNIEAISCGTPVVTYNTGGSPEMLNGKCGFTTKENTPKGIINAINKIKNSNISKSDCITTAAKYDKAIRFMEYIDLYKEIIK